MLTSKKVRKRIKDEDDKGLGSFKADLAAIIELEDAVTGCETQLSKYLGTQGTEQAKKKWGESQAAVWAREMARGVTRGRVTG